MCVIGGGRCQETRGKKKKLSLDCFEADLLEERVGRVGSQEEKRSLIAAPRRFRFTSAQMETRGKRLNQGRCQCRTLDDCLLGEGKGGGRR